MSFLKPLLQVPPRLRSFVSKSRITPAIKSTDVPSELTKPVPKKRKFLPDEDAAILAEVERAKKVGETSKFTKVARQLGRVESAVRNRAESLDTNLRKGQFAPEEDDFIVASVQKYQQQKQRIPWSQLARALKRRSSTVRDRWSNCLACHLNNKVWTEEEDKSIVQEGLEAANQSRPPAWSKLSLSMRKGPQRIGQRWRALNPTLKGGKWSKSEDDVLLLELRIAEKEGRRVNFNKVAEHLGRSNFSAYNRLLYLDPQRRWGKSTADEDDFLLKARAKGIRWCEIGGQLKRPDTCVQQRFQRLSRRREIHFPV